MSRTFTRGTPLYQIDVMMTAIPNFEPRYSGLHIYKRMKDKEAGWLWGSVMCIHSLRTVTSFECMSRAIKIDASILFMYTVSAFFYNFWHFF